jgi:hypothetical protein
MAHFRAKRKVAAIGPIAEPQQRRNVFLSFSGSSGQGILKTP